MAINPDWKPHADLESDVNAFLELHGFAHGSATYHNVLPKTMQWFLQRNNDPTSLYIRTRSDRIAVHTKHKNCSFQYEGKTQTGKYKNMALEAIQLAQHVMARRLGVRTLYIYRDETHGVDRGFWNTSIPPIARIDLTPGHEGIEGVFAIAFPNVPIRRLPAGYVTGSGDPYCLVMWEHVEQLRDWRHLIADHVAASEG